MSATGTPLQRQFSSWMFAGLLAFAPHLVAVLIAASLHPGFNHRAQFISELGERGSSTAFLINFLGVLPTGGLLAAFGLGLLLSYRAHRLLAVAGALITLHGLCRVLTAFFPCDVGCRPAVPSLSQLVHNAAAIVAFVALTGALFTAGAWLFKRKRGAAAVATTYALGVTAVLAQVLLVVGAGNGNDGLYQRVALGSLQLWVSLLALHLIESPLRAER